MRWASWLSIFVIGAGLGLSAPAIAADDVAKADALFAEGRALLDRGEVEAACEKLDQSFRIAPRLGVMLNLGACLERSGRLSRALAMYERAATMARDASRPDRERAARELAAAVEPRVAKLLLVVESAPPGLVVDVDGEAISTHGGLVPVDPGKRTISARAPGKVPWTATFDAAGGRTMRMAVPVLADETPAPSGSSAATLVSHGETSGTAEPPPPPTNTRTIGIVAGLGTAAAGAVVGTIFGLRAKSIHEESAPFCSASGCAPEGLAKIDDARSAGNVSTVAFVVAGAGIATAVLFWVLAPKPGRDTSLSPMKLRVTF